jgi:hypothetical protein
MPLEEFQTINILPLRTSLGSTKW